MKEELDDIRHLSDQAREELKEDNDSKISELLAEIKETANDLKQIDDDRQKAYAERNKVVVSRLRFYQELDIDVAYKVDQEAPEWKVWYIKEQDHKVFGHIGQMGWHIHEDEIDPEETEWIDQKRQEYDGHTDEEKYSRLQDLEETLRNTFDIEELKKVVPSEEDLLKVKNFLVASEEEHSVGEVTKHTGLPRDKAQNCLEKLQRQDEAKVYDTVGRTKMWVAKE